MSNVFWRVYFILFESENSWKSVDWCNQIWSLLLLIRQQLLWRQLLLCYNWLQIEKYTPNFHFWLFLVTSAFSQRQVVIQGEADMQYTLSIRDETTDADLTELAMGTRFNIHVQMSGTDDGKIGLGRCLISVYLQHSRSYVYIVAG